MTDTFFADLVARSGERAANPDWVGVLKDVAADQGPAVTGGTPFAAVLAPYVRCARTRLDTLGTSITATAQADLDALLLERLTAVAHHTLRTRLAGFAAARQSSLDRLLARAAPDTAGGEQFLADFVAAEVAAGPAALWSRFPVLGRLLGQTVVDWVDLVVELHQRLHADAPMIGALLQGPAPGPVARWRGNLSDPHRGARSVFVATFTDGRQVVYKPKNLAMERGLGEAIAWLNAQGPALTLTSPRVLDRGTHGWVSYVPSAPCADLGAQRRYATRCGMLLCLAYVLDATDLHLENIVGSGEHPVIVDAESLMQPLLPSPLAAGAAASAAALIAQQLTDSVLRTAMLPRWRVDRSGRSYDVSAAAPAQAGGESQDGTSLVATHLDAFVEGFTATYELIAARREGLLAPGGPVAAMAPAQARYIFRNTHLYLSVISSSLQWACTADAAKRAATIGRLAVAAEHHPDKELVLTLARAEITAVDRLDVPLFTARPDSTDLVLDDGTVLRGAFSATAVDRVTRRVRQMGPGDLTRQVGHIRASFLARFDRPAPARGAGAGPGSTPPGDDELVAAAEGIGADLLERVVTGAGGTLAWLTLARQRDSQHRQLAPMGDDLYGGTAGVALFLAALTTVTGAPQWGQTAAAILRHAHTELLRSPAARTLGLASGVPSLLYTLVAAARMLQDQALLVDARRLVDLITPQVIASDSELDVLGGASGAVLALLTLHQQTGDSAVLDTATRCGEHLLAHRRDDGTGSRAWATAQGEVVSGFAHGASGIAHALLRLWQATGSARFHDAAVEGLRWEQATYSPGARNWARTPGRRQCDTRWCSGAPGIALPRLGVEGHTRELEVALRTTEDYEHTAADLDGLCCGNSGRAEVLVTAGAATGSAELLGAGRAVLGQVLRRARIEGGYRCFNGPAQGFLEPNLFGGVAGVGYTMLRAARPELVPSVLAFA